MPAESTEPPAFGPNFKNPHNAPLAELPLAPFPATEKGPHYISHLPTSELALYPCHGNYPPFILFSSTHFLLIPLCHFLWVCQKGEEIFLSLVCFTPLLPSVHPGPSSLCFSESCRFGLSICSLGCSSGPGWEGGLVHRPARGVGEMCLFKLIRIFSSRNANGGKAIKAACFLLSNLC